MQKKKLFNVSAFSLIELSIVLIIIGLITAGVTGGRVLIDKSRITGARLLTKGSPVPTIEDLIIWLEPTMEGSFLDTNDAEIDTDSTAVKTWRNRAGWGGYLPNATQGTSGSRPLYIEEGINKLPTVRFDGTDDNLVATLSHSLPVATDEFTVFAIVSLDVVSSTITRLYGWGHPTGQSHKSPHFSLYNSLWTFSFWSSPWIAVTSPAPVANTPILITWRYDGTTMYGYIDGSPTTPASTTREGQTPSSNSFIIGSYPVSPVGASPWDGDISEIIMYDRSLTDDERSSVEDYLKQKYKIN